MSMGVIAANRRRTLPVVYPLDAVTAVPSFAFSTRKLRAAYTGPCLRVRRASDNAEADIGFASDATVSIADLRTFSSNDTIPLYVKTAYNQSTSGIGNATQTTALDQPFINSFSMRGARGITGRQTDKGLVVPTHTLERSTMAAIMVGGGYHDQNAFLGLDTSGRGLLEYVNPWLTIPEEQGSSTPAHVRIPYGMEVFGYNRNGSTLTKFSAEMQATDTGLFTSAYSGPITLGGYPTYNLVLNGAFSAAILFDASLSGGDLEALRSGLESAFNLSRSRQALVGIVGDSIVVGTPTSQQMTPAFAARIRSDCPANVHLVTHGSGSSLSTTFPSIYADLKAAALTPMDIVIHQHGTNDIGSGSTPAAIYSQIQTNCAAIRADGSLAIVATILPAFGYGSQADRDALNVLIRNGWATFADGLLDLAADPVYGPSAASGDPTLYPDSIHPSPYCLSLQGEAYNAAINAAVALL